MRNAKGGHELVVPVHPGLAPLFLAYLTVRRQSSDPALFLGVHGRRLTAGILANVGLEVPRPEALEATDGATWE